MRPQQSARSRYNNDATEYRRFERQLYNLTKQTAQLSQDSSSTDLNHMLQQNGIKSSNNPSLYNNSTSHKSLPCVMSTSSLSSLASNHSNYSNPSVTSPQIMHSNLLKKNHSLSTLHYKLPTKHGNKAGFVHATNFSAPISPKYDSHPSHHKLPPIHKHKAHPTHRNTNYAISSNVFSGNNELRSYTLDHNKTKKQKKKLRTRQIYKTTYKQNIKRNQSTSALHLDLSTLSIDENSDKLHTHHVKKDSSKIPKTAHLSILTLNAKDIKKNILLQFDLAPKSIDNRSLYEMTENGAFKLNEFVLSPTGLDIEQNNLNQDRPKQNEYKATSSNFVEVSILGRGSSSVVYKTWDLKNRRFIASKCISVFEQDKRKQILNELQLLTDNDCANIVQFYGAYFYSGQVIFCLEYFDIGSLQELIEINGRIPLQFISYLIKYVLCAVDYLHSKKHIIYRDIKPSNILIDSRGSIKLSDFGIYHQCVDDDVFCNEVIGTTIYMSPQRLNGKQYSYLSDIWSVGLCVAQSIYPQFDLFTNYNESTMLIQQYILNTMKMIHEFFPKDVVMSEIVVDFMNKCLLREESVRWSAKQLIKHLFITKYNTISDNDFNSYLSHSNMNEIKNEKYKHEVVSMKSSLSQLVLKNKITQRDMEIPLQQIQTMRGA